MLGEKGTTDVGQIGDAVDTTALTFLDAHLRGDAAAMEVLKGNRLADTIPGKVRFESK